jgi:hypothetical protein
MVWIAAVLAVFLFYKFVERAHKVVFAKAIGAIVLLGSIILGGVVAYENRNYLLPNRENVTVKHHFSDEPVDSETLKAIASNHWNQLVQSSNYTISSFPKESVDILRSFTLWPLAEQNFLGKVTMLSDEELLAEFDAMGVGEKAKLAQVQFEKLQEERIDRLVRRFNEAKSTFSDSSKLKVEMVFMAASIRSLSDANQVQLSKLLSPSEAEMVESYRSFRAEQLELLRDNLNALNRDSRISFRICNLEDIPLKKVSFHASGMRLNRSTKNALLDSSTGGSTYFESDIIVPPKSCVEPAWTGRYKHFYDYDVSQIIATW